MMQKTIFPEKHEIEVNEYEELEIIWSAGERQSRFPNQRIRHGKSYLGLKDTIEKPHGLSDVMRQILREFKNEGSKRWISMLKRLEKNVPLNEIEDTLNLLVNSGVLVIREKNLRPNKGYHWKPMVITTDIRALEDLREMLGTKKNKKQWQNELIDEIEKIRVNWRAADSPLERKLESLINERVEMLKEGNIPRGKIKFRSIVLTFVYGRDLLAKGQKIPLRTLSSILWHNTKILDRYSKEITNLIGEPLWRICITTHPENIWIYGNAFYELEDEQPIPLTAGFPMILAEETILKSCFIPSKELKSIIIIENLTVFQTVLEKTYFGRKDVLVLWGEGYWNRLHKRILRDILKKQPTPAYIWCDLDGDGLEIAWHICQWISNHGSRGKPILMGGTEWEMTASKRPITERDIMIVQKPELISMFPDVTELIFKKKYTVEQERLLTYYDYLEKQLP